MGHRGEIDQELREAVRARLREVAALRDEALEQASSEAEIEVRAVDAWCARRYVAKLLWSLGDADLVMDVEADELLDAYARGIVGAARHRVKEDDAAARRVRP